MLVRSTKYVVLSPFKLRTALKLDKAPPPAYMSQFWIITLLLTVHSVATCNIPVGLGQEFAALPVHIATDDNVLSTIVVVNIMKY